VNPPDGEQNGEPFGNRFGFIPVPGGQKLGTGRETRSAALRHTLKRTGLRPDFGKSGVDSPAHFWLTHTPFEGNFMYAVLETGSKQYRVAAGDTVEIERLTVEAGRPVTFDRVLLVNRDGKVSVGAPTVSGASVMAEVVEHKRGEKTLTFKMKRRKGYHKTIGHRQELTVVKIKEIKA
jgi:large subunit ribosomal protein L21